MHRFFVPPNWITPPHVSLQGEIARQISTVLRMRPGDGIIVLDDTGTAWEVRLASFDRDKVRGEITGRRLAGGEPRLSLSLYQGTLKGQKFEWVLQKGTELGISRFIPTVCERSVVSSLADLEDKTARWQRILREAAEQSGRGRLPRLEPAVPLSEALAQAVSPQGGERDLALLAWEGSAGRPLKMVLRQQPGATRIALFIGPEGGFAPEEAAQARAAGVEIVRLGPRILRAETAGLAAGAAILYELGEWD